MGLIQALHLGGHAARRRPATARCGPRNSPGMQTVKLRRVFFWRLAIFFLRYDGCGHYRHARLLSRGAVQGPRKGFAGPGKPADAAPAPSRAGANRGPPRTGKIPAGRPGIPDRLPAAPFPAARGEAAFPKILFPAPLTRIYSYGLLRSVTKYIRRAEGDPPCTTPPTRPRKRNTVSTAWKTPAWPGRAPQGRRPRRPRRPGNRLPPLPPAAGRLADRRRRRGGNLRPPLTSSRPQAKFGIHARLRRFLLPLVAALEARLEEAEKDL